MKWDKIELVIFDCDGVLTDGKITYDENEIESKNFSAKDGLGIKLLQYAGVTPAIITGRKSKLLARRCSDLGITILHQGISNKLLEAENLLKELDLQWKNVAYIGDDWNDYPVIEKVGISVAPADAFESFKKKVDLVTERKGGDGAVREFIELLLTKQNKYETTVSNFIEYLKNK